ncbi:methylenetetrahydrofolate reductase [Streptomyces sp. NPDC001941]|uniref:methylenetetrahydrofolate reductase n=1 Tax=Streptomyces sp. NPDC001941 TaxID=3154659 RepID=UPI00331BE769
MDRPSPAPAPSAVPATAPASLLEDHSLEMTGKDVPGLEAAREHIPPGNRVNVTFLGNEEPGTRRAAARAVRAAGLVPVPHLSARRLRSRDELAGFLDGLRADGTVENVLVVGGDPATAHGPYDDALALIRSGLLQAHGVRHVGVAGYPEGHPAIATPELWAAVEAKNAALAREGLTGDVVTQFCFDAAPVLAWIEELRGRGVTAPVRVGVPGPAGVKRLMTYATRFGVSTSASIARKYGFSLTGLMGTAGPDRFVRALADGYEPARHGVVRLHFYTFGGIAATARWIAGFRAEEGHGRVGA